MKRSALLLAVICTGLIAAPAHADVIIGPRVAYYFDNSNLRTSSIAGGVQDIDVLFDEVLLQTIEAIAPGEAVAIAQQDGIGVLADQIAVPMYGATLNFGDDRDRFTVTGLYGQGSGSFSQTQAVSTNFQFRDIQAVDLQIACLPPILECSVTGFCPSGDPARS